MDVDIVGDALGKKGQQLNSMAGHVFFCRVTAVDEPAGCICISAFWWGAGSGEPTGRCGREAARNTISAGHIRGEQFGDDLTTSSTMDAGLSGVSIVTREPLEELLGG